MFPEFINFIDFGQKELSEQKFVVIQEFDSDDGIFIINHFLSSYLKRNSPVCFVGLKQKFSHYNNVASKLSLDLKKLRDEGKFLFIDGLQWMSQCSWEAPNTSLKELYSEIKDSVHKLGPAKAEIIIIDDISPLLSVGHSTVEVVSFIQYLKNLAKDSDSKLVVVMHTASENSDEDMECVLNNLFYQCDLLLKTEPLKTGYCKEISGEVTAIWRDPLQTRPKKQIKKSSHYKLHDRNIVMFPIGLSSVVV